eukprot:TRINITY_DN1154_c0_g2_i3.p1 TRINITY_DN1154_c0_g2~~TRINITY_DN1154_c0_g2_i3.p1  ORF type:complete len:179 (-),score=39.19 TRINITY_DN1154_c0_g2_i3:25-561(-)
MERVRASFLMLVALTLLATAVASDPDPISDYVVEGNPKAEDFKFSGLLKSFKAKPGNGELIFDAGDARTFPVLQTQGLSVAMASIGPKGAVPIHTHPRASEIFVLLKGKVEVAFIDTKGNVFNNTLLPGEMAVFPRGLAHGIVNKDKGVSLALAAVNSASPGIVFLQPAIAALLAALQ